MAKLKRASIISEESVINKIYKIRGQKIMLDSDLAYLYGVETKVLNQSVKRNIKRFPPDFMFQLSAEEFETLKSQIVTPSWGGRRTLPYAFTELGVAMLSSVLNSETAIAVHIQIIRVFAKTREMLLAHREILDQVEKLELKFDKHDADIQLVFKYLKQLLNPAQPPRRRIGFRESH